MASPRVGVGGRPPGGGLVVMVTLGRHWDTLEAEVTQHQGGECSRRRQCWESGEERDGYCGSGSEKYPLVY